MSYDESITRDTVLPSLTEKQVDLREKVRTQHQANVDAIKRRGFLARVGTRCRRVY